MAFTQSRFSRTMANEEKMGAYYTDTEHCSDLSGLFLFPQEEEVCVLEPSIGDGSAVIAVTDKLKRPNVKIFGVELDYDVATATQANPLIEECIRADFLDSVRISNNKFSFVFANPPYMTDKENGERVEKQFLEKIGAYMKKDAVLVWVIPHYVYTESTYFRYLNSRYEVLKTYRMRPKEYEKYHQVIIVARKRHLTKMFTVDVMKEMRDAVTPVEKIPELPSSFSDDEKIEVYPSDSSEIGLFASKIFNNAEAYEVLKTNPTDELEKEIEKGITTKEYSSSFLGKPPIPLKNDHCFLLSAAGVGQGAVGNEENGDYHLQRGVAQVIEDGEISEDEAKVKVTSRTTFEITLLEANGNFITLK